MKKKRKKVLIIVRGAKPLHFKNHIFENAGKLIFSKLTSKKGLLKESYNNLANFFSKHYDIVEQLGWDGDIMKNPTLSLPIEQLNKILKSYRNSDIDIIAVSLGGHVVEKALKEKSYNKINKLMYIGAVHDTHHRIRGINKIINIYSKKDKMFFFSNNLIEGIGNFMLKGKNVINMALDELSHDSLLRNIRINQKGIKEKRLYDFYRNMLLNG